MYLFEIVSFILLGLISGSFVNVCLTRLPLQFLEDQRRLALLSTSRLSKYLLKQVSGNKLSLIKPSRSFCFSCGHQLSWFENIPVLSYLLNEGLCRKCNEKIGYRTIVIEIIHGIIYSGFYLIFSHGFFSLVFCIDFSFLIILFYCRGLQKARKVFYFTGTIIVLFNLVIYLMVIR